MISSFKQKTYEFLRWSQKYTKTDMVYLAKGGFWLTLGQIISTAASFLLAVAFANLLPKETFGTYQYIFSIFGILSIFTLQGMRTAIIQATARGYEGSLIPALKTKVRWGMLGTMACLILAGYYFFKDNVTLTFSFLIAAIFLSFLEPLGIYDALLHGRKLFKISTKYQVISQIVTTAAIIVTLLLTKNIFLILLAYFSPRALLRLILLKTTLKKFQPNKKIDPETLSYGKYLSFIRIIPRIADELDKMLLWYFLGAAQVAIYTFAITPVIQIKDLVYGKLKVLASPKLSQRSERELKMTLPRKIFKLFLTTILIVILYIALAPFIYKIFFPQYPDSVVYSQIFAIILLFTPRLFLATALSAQKKKREIGIITFVSSGAKIILLLILVPVYGIIGVVLAWLITNSISIVLTSYLFKKAFSRI